MAESPLSKALEEYVVADPANPTVSELTVVVICQRGELDDASDDREGMEATISSLEAMVADHETKVELTMKGHKRHVEALKSSLKELVAMDVTSGFYSPPLAKVIAEVREALGSRELQSMGEEALND